MLLNGQKIMLLVSCTNRRIGLSAKKEVLFFCMVVDTTAVGCLFEHIETSELSVSVVQQFFSALSVLGMLVLGIFTQSE